MKTLDDYRDARKRVPTLTRVLFSHLTYWTRSKRNPRNFYRDWGEDFCVVYFRDGEYRYLVERRYEGETTGKKFSKKGYRTREKAIAACGRVFGI